MSMIYNELIIRALHIEISAIFIKIFKIKFTHTVLFSGCPVSIERNKEKKYTKINK